MVAAVCLSLVALLVLAARADALTVADGEVYWVKDSDLDGNGGTIGRANIDGSGVRAKLVKGIVSRPGESANGALVVHGRYLYWGVESASSRGNRGRIGRARLNGKGVRHNLVRRVEPGSLAAHGRYVYWTNFVNYSPSPRGVSIGRARLNGGGMQRKFIKAGRSARVGAGIAADRSGIYWGGGRGTGIFSNGTQTISRASLDGKTIKRGFLRNPGRDASNFGAVVDIDNSSLYYTTTSAFPSFANGLSYAPLARPASGGELFEFARLRELTAAVDDSYLYWIDRGTRRSRIMRAPILRESPDEGEPEEETVGKRERVVTIRHGSRHDVH